MFKQELTKTQKDLNAVRGEPGEIGALKKAIEFGENRQRRIDDEIKTVRSQFKEKKATFGLNVSDDEVPHEIREQVGQATGYRTAEKIFLILEAGLAIWIIAAYFG